MSIDTEIKGSPASVGSAADWLRHALGKAVSSSADQLAGSRATAASGWRGEAGAAFVARMGTAVAKVDALTTSVSSVAGELEAYASKLRSLQSRMADIRAAAQAAGLTVAARVIQEPGPGPASPGQRPAGPVPPVAADAHESQVRAWNAHQDKIDAYRRALTDAEQVRADLASAVQELDDAYQGLTGPEWMLNASSIAGGFAGAAVQFTASALRGTADDMAQVSREYVERVKARPGAFTNLDLDHWDKVAQNADEMARNADDLARTSKAVPLKAGGALAVAGVGLDIAGGEDPVQAVASGGGGLLASVAAGAGTGAVVGSFVPVPGVGTAAGAVVGAGVGIFTSGAIDSLFENGPDVGAALDEGLEALTDTGDAIGDGVGDLVDGIGGVLD